MILQELQSRRDLKDYFVRTLGENVAILNVPEPDKLLKELRKAGYLPINDDSVRGQKLLQLTAKRTHTRQPAHGRPDGPTPGENAAPPAVDWSKFARDDGRPYREARDQELPQSRPDNSVSDKGNIRFLLLDAIRRGVRVQVAYQGQADASPQVRIVEPLRVMGNFVIAYLPLEAEQVTLNINRVVWAKKTSDVFDQR